jgi:hypothetical protein
MNLYEFVLNRPTIGVDSLGKRLVADIDMSRSVHEIKSIAMRWSSQTAAGLTSNPTDAKLPGGIARTGPTLGFYTIPNTDCCCAKLVNIGEVVVSLQVYIPALSEIGRSVTQRGWEDIFDHEMRRVEIYSRADAEYFEGFYKATIPRVPFICRKSHGEAAVVMKSYWDAVFGAALEEFTTWSLKEQGNLFQAEPIREPVSVSVFTGEFRKAANGSYAPIYRTLWLDDGFSGVHKISNNLPSARRPASPSPISGCGPR